jgi:hypothetical protein
MIPNPMALGHDTFGYHSPISLPKFCTEHEKRRSNIPFPKYVKDVRRDLRVRPIVERQGHRH